MPVTAGDVPIAHDMGDDVAVDMTADVAAPVVDTGDTFGAAHPHRGTRVGSCSAFHLSVATPPTAGESTETATPTATNLTAPFPPDMTGDTADGATATATSAAGTGVDVGTGPNPAAIALPAAEHISSFLLHIRQYADDKAAGLTLGSAPPDAGAGVAAVRLLVSPSRWSPLTADPATNMDVGTADDSSGDGIPRAGVMMMRSRQQYQYAVMPR